MAYIVNRSIRSPCWSPVDKKELKHEDLLELSNLFSSEFNKSGLDDRVLVFQVENERSDECPLNLALDDDIDLDQLDVTCLSNDGSEGRVLRRKRRRGGVNTTPQKCIKKEDAEVQEPPLTQHKLLVHSCWLSVQSPYFKALLFSSGMKESLSKEVVMTVAQSELEAHLTLVEAMYKIDILDNKDHALVLQVLTLSDKYEVNVVFKKCKYVLMDTPQTIETCETIIETLNGLTNCEDLLEAQTQFLVSLCSPLDKTWTTDTFLNLSENAILLLMSSDQLTVQSENTVFVALMRWIEHTSTNDDFTKPALLDLVRFELMTPNFLYDIVSNHPTAMKISGFDNLLKKGLAYHSFSQKRKAALADIGWKPAYRTLCVTKEPALNWLLDMKTREVLLTKPVIGAFSKEFWFKGYQMKLNLVYNSTSKQYSVYLLVRNLPMKLSYLYLSWSAKSMLFLDGKVSVTQKYGNGTFKWGRTKVQSSPEVDLTSSQMSYVVRVSVKILQ